MSSSDQSEFVYELLTCRWAERAWPPHRERDAALVVSRQLGTRERRWDTVVVEVDPEGVAERARFGTRTLDSDLLHIVRHAPAEWAWYRDALPHPGYPWRYVRAAVHRAAGRGVVEKRRRDNRIEIRRIAPYPDWVRRLVAIENKPDLTASAARTLSEQLEHDVETAMADEVWVATAATGATIEPALLETIPVEVGILVTDFDGGELDADVEWYPSRLGGDGADEDETDAARARKRLELAERAYGSGWRSYLDTMRPDCRFFELDRRGEALIPWCAANECHQSSAVCSGKCTAFQPEPPTWRMGGWPIQGGPGKGVRSLLGRRREWVRRTSVPEE
ncbi:MAG: DUF5787 family protein [Halobacteriota archaeon]